MFYYEIAINAHALNTLTYHSIDKLERFSAVMVSVGKKELLGYIWQEVAKPNFQTKEILSTKNLALTKFQAELANFISYYYASEIGISTALFEPFDKNLLENFKNCNILEQTISENSTNLPQLNEKQKKALNFALDNSVSLIFGDTGCGKSEIYISAIKKTLQENKQVLFLMPEISLTPQMKTRLERYFGANVGIWHSKITKAKKKKLLENFLNNKINLIAGARSALFLPFTNLGLIIVDEEHDESYKAANKPTYNAKDLAIWLAKNKNFNIKTILGSATPSLNSYYKIPSIRLKGTFFDSSKEFIFDNSTLGLSKSIINELNSILEAKKQAVIFLPTRGNFKMLLCKNCAKSVLCPYCAVSMSLHKKENVLKCHYCGYRSQIPQICTYCGNEVLQSKKIGTSELKLQLNKALPNAKIEKFDRDEITSVTKLEEILQNFNDKNIDILVGTQMLSKGHDYHNVALAVVLGLDEYLSYPDYRAQEKTLALALQIAGRTGRAGHGKIIIQTARKDIFEKYLNDFELLLKDEISLRNGLYPPFSRLMRILISNKNENLALKTQNSILLELANIKNLEIIGYGKANIAYIAGKFRFNILLRSNTHAPLIQAGKIALKYKVLADIDPLNFN